MDNSNNDVSNNNLELVDVSPTPTYEGRMTQQGLYINDEDKTFIPRAKKEARHGLTEEDENAIQHVVNALKIDFPNSDPAVLEMIATWNHENPEGFEKKVAEMKERDNRPPEEVAKDLFSKNEFGEIEDNYERVY